MSNIRQSKLDLLVQAHKSGVEVTEKNAPEILGIKTPNSVKNYLNAFLEWRDGEPATEAPEAPKTKAKKTFGGKQAEKLDLSKYNVVLEDENGAELEEQFEVVATTSNTIVIREVKPIIKSVTIAGKQVKVDLRELRKLSPDAIFQGVKVSTLLVVAEIA